MRVSRLLQLSLGIWVALGISLPHLAQSPRSSHPQVESANSDTILRVNSELVSVDVTVVDEKGDYVHGLSATDFALFEDGKPCPIEFFQPNSTQGPRLVSMVFAIDFSGSVTRDEATTQQRALSTFLNDQNPNSLFALIGFNDEVNVLENFTKDRKRLLRAFEKQKEYGGSTRIYDAIDRAITLLKKSPRKYGERLFRRYIVVLTDGFDSSSMVNSREVIRRATEEGISIYTVTVPSYTVSLNGRQRVPTLLDATRIAPSTGGRDFCVEEGFDYTSAFRAISAEVIESYTIAYQPSPESATPQFRKISVTTHRPRLTLRLSRQGFTK